MAFFSIFKGMGMGNKAKWVAAGCVTVAMAFGAPPPAKLSLTGLYECTATHEIKAGNLGYSPQYPLWSDGAKKRRWVYLPSGTQILNPGDSDDPWTGTSDHWLFPVGTKFWKEFSFQTPNGEWRRIETRYMEKQSEEEWIFASYRWNLEETEAIVVHEDGANNVFPIGPDTAHDIPSQTACFRCHRRGGDPVLGFDALQLSTERDALAPHAEPFVEGFLNLRTLIDEGRLSHVGPELMNGAVTIPSSNPKTRAVVGYFHSNCSSCHNANGTSLQVRMDMRYSLKAQSEADLTAITSTVNQPSQLFIIPGQTSSTRIVPGNPSQSSLVYQMENWGASHMPAIGTEILDEQGLTLIKDWITNLNWEPRK